MLARVEITLHAVVLLIGLLVHADLYTTSLQEEKASERRNTILSYYGMVSNDG